MKKLNSIAMCAMILVAVACVDNDNKAAENNAEEAEMTEIEDQDQFIEYGEEDADPELYAPYDFEEVTAFLNKVYPNKINPATPDEASVTTERFHRYSSIELDYVPLYMTQEGFALDMVPNVKISVCDEVPYAYTVEWDRYADDPQHVQVTVCLEKDGDNFLIDNIYKPMYGDSDYPFLFNYSKAPVSCYE